MSHMYEDPTWISVPVRSFSAGGAPTIATMDVPILDIHELLDYLCNEVKIQCPHDQVREYWKHLRDVKMPFALSHPGTDKHVPFSIYGDECVIGQDPHDKVLGLFISLTLFRPRSVRRGQFLVFAMHVDSMINDELATLMPVLQHLVWSANMAFEGRYPVTAMDGSPLPPKKQARAGRAIGRCFACCEIKGDWKFHEKWLRLIRTPVSVNPCFLCNAQNRDNDMRYYNTDEDAAWIDTEVDTHNFISDMLRPGPISAMAGDDDHDD